MNQSLEHTLTAQTKIYYDLHAPNEIPAPLLIALHGYGGSKRQMMREARQIAPENFAIAALQGVHQHIREPRIEGEPLRYGFGWLTNFHPEESIGLAHRAIDDLINALTNEKIVDRERIFLLGFSQSVALLYRYVFTRGNAARGIIGICGGLPGDWERNENYKKTRTGILHLTGARDEFYPPARTEDYAGKLRTRAQDVEVKTYADAAHEITDAMRGDVRAWLQGKAAK
jgi:predicted esterase